MKSEDWIGVRECLGYAFVCVNIDVCVNVCVDVGLDVKMKGLVGADWLAGGWLIGCRDLLESPT